MRFRGVRLPERLPFEQQVDLGEACERAISIWVRTRPSPVNLSHDDYDDLVADLAFAAWRLSEGFDPARGVRFGVYLGGILPNRCNDWLRRDKGRTVWKFADSVYERERERPLSLDATVGSGDDARELGDVVAGADLSERRDWDEALGWLEHTRDRDREWHLRVLRDWMLAESSTREVVA